MLVVRGGDCGDVVVVVTGLAMRGGDDGAKAGVFGGGDRGGYGWFRVWILGRTLCGVLVVLRDGGGRS